MQTVLLKTDTVKRSLFICCKCYKHEEMYLVSCLYAIDHFDVYPIYSLFTLKFEIVL